MIKPLAFRMRPSKLDQVIGQDHLVGNNGFFTNLIKANTVISCILYGPPGTGKTTIAQAFCNSINVNYTLLNATTCSKADLLKAFYEAETKKDYILILDEIHRLNKDKQDLLLPRLEDGSIYLIGCTTANPLLAINPAIRSRCHLLEVKPLKVDEIILGLNRAIKDENGLNNSRKFDRDGLEVIAKLSGGDLRYAYNILEASSLTFSSENTITKEDILKLKAAPNYFSDKDENEHYDTVSAFQKSIRGSQVDAAIYYLGKLCASGDLEGLIRRLLVTAYEDVGLGNPQAVDRCYNACQVAREVGLPEAEIPLAFSVVDLALSPKSKSACLAIHSAMDLIEKYPSQVRDYLKLSPVNISKQAKYPYDRPDLWEHIQYMPEGFETYKFYIPKLTGNYEKSLNINYTRLENIKRSTDIATLKKTS